MCHLRLLKKAGHSIRNFLQMKVDVRFHSLTVCPASQIRSYFDEWSMLAGKAPRRLMACYRGKRQRSMPTFSAVKSEQLFLRRDTLMLCKICSPFPCQRAPPLLQNIRVVLVNTSHPGNIGGAARAMKNM